MLDRFDSMIFAAPILYLLAVLFPAFLASFRPQGLNCS